VEKDIVLFQDIMTGSRVDKNSVVNVVVSDGLPPEGVILMPNFINKNIKEAKIWASQYNVMMNVKTEEVPNIITNTIIKQYPECDTDITNAKSINVTVAVNIVNLE
jgi:serine/threonine-protein kinase